MSMTQAPQPTSKPRPSPSYVIWDSFFLLLFAGVAAWFVVLGFDNGWPAGHVLMSGLAVLGLFGRVLSLVRFLRNPPPPRPSLDDLLRVGSK